MDVKNPDRQRRYSERSIFAVQVDAGHAVKCPEEIAAWILKTISTDEADMAVF